MKVYIIFIIMSVLFLASCAKTELSDSPNSKEISNTKETTNIKKTKKETMETNKEIRKIASENIEKKERKGKFSCNSINKNSTCSEYYGSFWTEEEAKNNCDGTIVAGSCPVETIGGCNTGIGSVSDMVTWIYLNGGGLITTDLIKNIKIACSSTLMSNWVSK